MLEGTAETMLMNLFHRVQKEGNLLELVTLYPLPRRKNRVVHSGHTQDRGKDEREVCTGQWIDLKIPLLEEGWSWHVGSNHIIFSLPPPASILIGFKSYQFSLVVVVGGVQHRFIPQPLGIIGGFLVSPCLFHTSGRKWLQSSRMQVAPEKLHEVTGSYTMSRKARAGKGRTRAI